MLLGMFLVSLVVVVALVTVMSGIGVSEHCGVGSGGIYSMISTVLGSRVGGTVGLLYVFGQVSREFCFLLNGNESVTPAALPLFAVRGRSDVHHGVLGVSGGGAGAAGPVGGARSVGGGAAGTAGNQPGRGQVDRQAPAAPAGCARRLHAGLCHRHFHSPRSRWARQYLAG